MKNGRPGATWRPGVDGLLEDRGVHVLVGLLARRARPAVGDVDRDLPDLGDQGAVGRVGRDPAVRVSRGRDHRLDRGRGRSCALPRRRPRPDPARRASPGSASGRHVRPPRRDPADEVLVALADAATSPSTRSPCSRASRARRPTASRSPGPPNSMTRSSVICCFAKWSRMWSITSFAVDVRRELPGELEPDRLRDRREREPGRDRARRTRSRRRPTRARCCRRPCTCGCRSPG